MIWPSVATAQLGQGRWRTWAAVVVGQLSRLLSGPAERGPDGQLSPTQASGAELSLYGAGPAEALSNWPSQGVRALG